MAKVLLNMHFALEEIPTDLSNCLVCNDVIYGKMFVAVCYVESQPEKRIVLQVDDVDLKLCESCHTLV